MDGVYGRAFHAACQKDTIIADNKIA